MYRAREMLRGVMKKVAMIVPVKKQVDVGTGICPEL